MTGSPACATDDSGPGQGSHRRPVRRPRCEAPCAPAAVRPRPATVRLSTPADVDRRGEGRGRGGKGSLRSITDDFEDAAVCWLTALRRSARWRSTAAAIASRSRSQRRVATFDIGEKEGDGAAGQIGHDGSLVPRDMVRQWAIVARDSEMTVNSGQRRLGLEAALCETAGENSGTAGAPRDLQRGDDLDSPRIRLDRSATDDRAGSARRTKPGAREPRAGDVANPGTSASALSRRPGTTPSAKRCRPPLQQ